MTMLDRPDQIRMYFMLAQYHALQLEVQTGMRHSSRRGLAKFLRETYKLDCGRKKVEVLAAFETYLKERGALL